MSGEVVEYLISGLMPYRWTRILVPAVEPALDQGHPGAVGRGEVEREAGMALDLSGAVGRHVVQDDMHREVVGYLLVNQVEEALDLATRRSPYSSARPPPLARFGCAGPGLAPYLVGAPSTQGLAFLRAQRDRHRQTVPLHTHNSPPRYPDGQRQLRQHHAGLLIALATQDTRSTR